MTWRFAPDERLADAFRRVAEEEIAKIRSELDDEAGDHARAVHAARQGFKRLRALARLAKPALGPAFPLENRRWRDAGRLLSGSRDRTVLLQCFDRLIGDYGEELPDDQMKCLRREIIGNGTAHGAQRNAEDVQGALHLIEGAEEEVAALNWPSGASALFRGLRSSQAKLRETWKGARAHEAADALHEWRKRVKDQSAQLRLLRVVVPPKYRARRNTAKAVAELLGQEHDLWLLAEWLQSGAVPAGGAALRDRLLPEIASRRSALRRRAFKKGEGFSSERAGDFATAITEAWEKAQKAKARKRRSPA